MIKVNIVCVGTIKEKYFKDAIEEYSKRLSSFCNFNIIEVKEGMIVKNQADIDLVKKQEARLLEKYKKGYCFALEINGKQYDSVDFAHKIENLTNVSSEITFFIGGSNGLDLLLSNSCDEKISFGKLTYPHQLMRVVLTEQIYRAFMIINNRSYHK